MDKIDYIFFDWSGTLGNAKCRECYFIGKFDKALKPETISVIKALQLLNIPMGIITNTKYTFKDMDQSINHETSPLKNVFDIIICSGDPGNPRKPDPAIYDLGINKVFYEKKNIMYVGNNYTKDFISSLNHGMQSAVLDPKDEYKEEHYKKKNGYIIKNLWDLIPIVIKHNNISL